MNEFDDNHLITSDEDLEKLTLLNGFAVSDDGETINVELVYDGSSVTFRHESGQLVNMATLCYLDHVLDICARDLLEEDGRTSKHPAGVHPGHVVNHMVRHLHEYMHAVEVNSHAASIAALLGGVREDDIPEGGIDELIRALTGGRGQGAAFVLGPNGLEEVDLEEALRDASGEILIEEDEETPVEEIIIGEIPKRKH